MISTVRPEALDGINFGITTLNFIDGSGNGGLDKEPLIKGLASFRLSGVGDFLEAGISNVWFQYGTSITEPGFGGRCTEGCTTPPPQEVPEPASLALLGIGLIGLGAARKRRTV